MVRLEATFQKLPYFSFAILATIIGFISIGKQSKCGFTLYAVMSSICIIGKETFEARNIHYTSRHRRSKRLGRKLQL